MDLSTDLKLMGVQSRYVTECGNPAFKLKNIFKETDIKGNNNLFNSLKTEANSNHDHDPSSLFQVKCPNDKKLEVDDSLFSYSSFKKAMDLRIHNRTLDGRKRTIFDDAEYFAKNYRYKLLPISFEQVDETIIQSEHNYSLFSLNSESEPEENFSRTMDYSQIKEKNYKRRKTKFQMELLECGAFDDDGDESGVKSAAPLVMCHQNEHCTTELELKNASLSFEQENSVPVQPLDLSAAPLVQEEKTEPRLRERPNNIAEKNACNNDAVAQLDSDKENLNSELNGIRVTITRPDEKENYQPCDLFLNDIARLVPWLIDKDCFEVDILDRTCDRNYEFQKHRVYYVISESTWRLFQRTNERVILTNDQSLGQPLRKAEKDERPSYLVFDQYSLAKCLAEHCQEIGGCFEYTCIEEGKEEECLKEKEVDEIGKNESKEIKTIVELPRKLCEKLERNSETTEKGAEGAKEASSLEKKAERSREGNEHSNVKRTKAENIKLLFPELGEKLTNAKREKKPKPTDREANVRQREILRQVNAEVGTMKKDSKYKVAKKQKKNVKNSKNSVKLSKSKTTLSKSSSRPETSQKSGESVSKKGRRKLTDSALPTEEPPSKRNKSVHFEDVRRRTRSGRAVEKNKIDKPSAKKKENEVLKGRGRRGKKVEGANDEGRNLRSQVERQGSRRGKEREKNRTKRG